MIKRFIKVEYEFSSQIMALSFEVDSHEKSYCLEHLNNLCRQMNLKREKIKRVQLVEMAETSNS